MHTGGGGGLAKRRGGFDGSCCWENGRCCVRLQGQGVSGEGSVEVSLVRGFAVNRPISSGLRLMAVGLGGQTGRWRCAELRCQGGLGHCMIHSILYVKKGEEELVWVLRGRRDGDAEKFVGNILHVVWPWHQIEGREDITLLSTLIPTTPALPSSPAPAYTHPRPRAPPPTALSPAQTGSPSPPSSSTSSQSPA